LEVVVLEGADRGVVVLSSVVPTRLVDAVVDDLA
jgi:hypothetical protein